MDGLIYTSLLPPFAAAGDRCGARLGVGRQRVSRDEPIPQRPDRGSDPRATVLREGRFPQELVRRRVQEFDEPSSIAGPGQDVVEEDDLAGEETFPLFAERGRESIAGAEAFGRDLGEGLQVRLNGAVGAPVDVVGEVETSAHTPPPN